MSYFFQQQLIGRDEAIEDLRQGRTDRLTRVDLSDLNFDGLTLINASAGGIIFRRASLVDSVFRDSQLSSADFREANLLGAEFRGCNLKGAKFTNANLKDASFVDCVTQNVVWPDSRMMRGVFRLENIGGQVGVQPRGRTAFKGVRRFG